MDAKKKWIGMGAGLLGALTLVTVGFQSVSASAAENPEQPRPFQAMRREHRFAMLETGAEKLGLTPDELKSEIQSGKPFYQIAAEHGMTYEKAAAEELRSLKTRLDDMVKVGYMTQNQADDVYKKAEQDPMTGMHLGMPHGGPGLMMSK